LYTPPVVVSDDGAIQMIGLETLCLWEVHRYFFNRGSKSRNKVAVGEPAAGSFFRKMVYTKKQKQNFVFVLSFMANTNTHTKQKQSSRLSFLQTKRKTPALPDNKHAWLSFSWVWGRT